MIDAREFAEDFARRFGSVPVICSAPGRVNLIGEHTDYNEGFVLPFAIDRRTFAAVSSRTDGIFTAVTRTLDRSVEFRVGDPLPKEKDWSVYVRGIVAVLIEKGSGVTGANILIDSDVPFGAGLSSSAALEVSLGMALTQDAAAYIDRRELAFAGQRVEHEFAGVRSGIMDQFASALGEAGQAILIDCRSLEFEEVPLDHPDACFLLCDTGVKHSLASSEYNKRRSECEEGVAIFQKHLEGITSLRDIHPADLERLSGQLPEPIEKRCRHVVSENARTLAAVAALRRGDLIETGRLMFLSHQSLQYDYEVSSPELDLLVDSAMRVTGVFGSRMTGGGFGGCTINLVSTAVVEDFTERVSAEYADIFGREPTIMAVVPSEGARRESP